MLVSFKQTKLPVPGEDAWIEVRPLSGSEQTEAKEARSLRALRMARELGSDMYEAMQKLRKDAESGATADKHDAFDRDVTLRAAITRWSYKEPLNASTIALLDEPTADWLHRQVIALTLPDDQGNSTRPSPVS